MDNLFDIHRRYYCIWTNFDEHLARVAQVLDRLKEAGLKLKPEKCHMLQREVVFLGHVVTAEGVKPHPTNTDKIIGWPKTPRQVKQLVAMGSYYSQRLR